MSYVANGDGMTGVEQTEGSLPVCPVCGVPSVGPFCVRDGTITGGPFEVDGRYRVEELLGGGGLGIVFGARHLVLGKRVALKVLRNELASDPKQVERFLREARNASQLCHENIVDITDFGHDANAGLIYLVMERVTGTTLDRVVKPRLAFDRALRILVQLARAMVAAHAAGVVHRDIKPRNIFLVNSPDRDDHLKLCDFGLSPLSDGKDGISALGAMLGAPAYMAPEQLRGDPNQDHRVDIYGFGCTAYEIVTGQHAHRATTPAALLASASGGPTLTSPSELVPDGGVPPELDELIIRCLSDDPGARPATAAELEAILGRMSPTPRTPSVASSLSGQLIGTHRVTRLLGEGASGRVYQAEHPLIRTQVAIKVLRAEISSDPAMVEAFVLEARASSSIGSPHIPRLFDFGHLPNGQAYTVMELFEGETLGSRLRRGVRMSLEEVVAILIQVASAIAQAHAHGLVHRDLKPDNVFLARDAGGHELVKVLDFGIAGLLASASRASVLDTLPIYSAPEQTMGLAVGPSADVYALGAIGYEMLTGQPPFKGEGTTIVGAKTTRAAPPIRRLRPDLPGAVERGIAEMLVRYPAARTATMVDVLAELATWTRDSATPLPTTTIIGHGVAIVPRTDPSEAAVTIMRAVAPRAPEVEQSWESFDDVEPPRRRWNVGWLVAGGVVLAVAAVVIFALDGEPDRRSSAGSDARTRSQPVHGAASSPRPPPAAPRPPIPKPEPAPSVPPPPPPVIEQPPVAGPDESPPPSQTAIRDRAPAPGAHRAPRPPALDRGASAAPRPSPVPAPGAPASNVGSNQPRPDPRKPGDGVIFDPFKD